MSPTSGSEHKGRCGLGGCGGSARLYDPGNGSVLSADSLDAAPVPVVGQIDGLSVVILFSLVGALTG